MSQDYVLFQKCLACGTRKERSLNAIKTQRIFECTCCGLTLRIRSYQEPKARAKTVRKDEALAL